jgi:hypothetical protein
MPIGDTTPRPVMTTRRGLFIFFGVLLSSKMIARGRPLG